MKLSEISISGEKIFEILGLPITNTFFVALLSGGIVFLLFYFGFKKREILPGSFQNFAEWLLESILNFIDNITQDRKKTEEIFPLAVTLFFFILVANLSEILPGLGVFKFLRAPSSDLNFTLAIAFSSMVFVHILAIAKLGFFSHLGKFVNFKNPIFAFIGGLEAFSELVKVLSLGIRLFGNLFAGEVLLLVVFFLFPFILPLPFLFLEILISFIQALIFFSLIVIFYNTAVQKVEHH